MKTLDLNGKEHIWNLTGYVPLTNETRPRSSLHLDARQVLQEQFPTDRILEEVSIPGHHLFLDFFIPRIKLAIEVHGEQHYKFVAHFHENLAGFARAKKNDNDKIAWCRLNNIKHVVFPHTESPNEWRTKIS